MRSVNADPTLLVTGGLTLLGAAVASGLPQAQGVGRVLALGGTRSTLPGVTWRVGDVLDPGITSKFKDVATVVHLDIATDVDAEPVARAAVNLRAAETVLTAAAAAGVPRVVLVTSAMVFGAEPTNPVPLAEDAPLRATPAGLVADLLAIEELAQRARRVHPGLDVVVLRPATIVGAGLDTAVARHFAAPRLVGLRDSRMCWQFCHVEDLTAAIAMASIGSVSGSAVVASPGWLEQSQAAELAELRTVELPANVVFAAGERLHRARLTPSPASDLNFVSYPWVVDPVRLLEAGWRPRFDNAAALRVLTAEARGQLTLAGRRLGRRDATIAGAGAGAVALVGAAALVRRTRRTRGR